MKTLHAWGHMSRVLPAVAIAMVSVGSVSGSAWADDAKKMPPSEKTMSRAWVDLENYRGVKATQLLGMTVTDSQGKSLGKVEDFIFRPATGAIRYAVLSFGGTMGVGDDLYAIPLRDLEVAAEKDELVAPTLTKERLDTAKHFARDAWPDDKRYWDDADKIYGITSETTLGTPSAVRAKEFVGSDVASTGGSAAGEVEDLVVDLNSEMVHYVILKTDASLGGKSIAVPSSAFRFASSDTKPALDIDRTKVLSLAQYDRWPEVNDSTAVRGVERGWKDVFPRHGERREG